MEHFIRNVAYQMTQIWITWAILVTQLFERIDTFLTPTPRKM